MRTPQAGGGNPSRLTPPRPSAALTRPTQNSTESSNRAIARNRPAPGCRRHLPRTVPEVAAVGPWHPVAGAHTSPPRGLVVTGDGGGTTGKRSGALSPSMWSWAALQNLTFLSRETRTDKFCSRKSAQAKLESTWGEPGEKLEPLSFCASEHATDDSHVHSVSLRRAVDLTPGRRGPHAAHRRHTFGAGQPPAAPPPPRGQV